MDWHERITLDPAVLVGKPCIKGTRISVELVVPRMSVYVAREFSPASCSYRQVLEHEMRHVQLYRDQFPGLANSIRHGLAARFGGKPLYAAHGKGLEALETDVDHWLRPFIKAEIGRMEVAQAKMDTPDESFRLSIACQGELANNLGNRY